MCLRARPAVDGLEREFEGEADILRADIQTDAGRLLARRFRLHVVPAWVVFDRSGEVVFADDGTDGVPAEVRSALRRLTR